jgi:hypothetical protein
MRPETSDMDAAIAAGEEVLHPHDRASEAEVEHQIDAMFTRDRLMAIGFVVALLVVVPFVLVVVWQHAPSTGVRVVLLVSGLVVLVYNVASMVALVVGFRRDRDFVYRRDVAHLRERAALKGQR